MLAIELQAAADDIYLLIEGVSPPSPRILGPSLISAVSSELTDKDVRRDVLMQVPRLPHVE